MRSITISSVTLTALAFTSFVVACDEPKPQSQPTTASSMTATPPPVASAPAPKASLTELMAKAVKNDVEAWNAHDAKKLGALYTANAKLVIPGTPEVVGRDAIEAATKMNFTAFPDFKVAVTRSFAKGNTTATEWVVTGKNDGEFMGQKATGRPIGLAGATVTTYGDDGLIKEEHRYFDMPTSASQLDAKAKAGTFRAPMALPTGAIEEHVWKESPENAKALADTNAFYAALESKKEADTLALITEESLSDDYTTPGTVKGVKGFKELFTTYVKAFPDFAQTKPVQFAADGVVVSEGVFTGTHKGPLGPLKATNKPVSLRFVDIVQMKDGKVTQFRTYANSAEMLVQMGVMPAMGAAPAASASAAAPAAPKK